MDKIKKIFFIGGCLVVMLSIVFLVIYALNTVNNRIKNALVCTSSNGNITLFHDNNNITGYSNTENYAYDLIEGQEQVRQMGLDAYLEDYAKRYATINYGGTCTKY